MLEGMIAGFALAATAQNILYIAFGLVIGFAVGVLPGLNRSAAVAIAIPMSFYLPPIVALSFLIGIAKGGACGGAITAILVNTPGEPSSAATCLDGYPMARQGKAGKALRIALVGGVFGDFVATLLLIAIAEPLARMALRIGPVEMVAILIFALAFIAGLSGSSLGKGIVAGLMGMLFACVGLDIETGGERLMFGYIELSDGIPLIAVGLGMLAVAEKLSQVEERGNTSARILGRVDSADGGRMTGADLRRVLPTYTRASGIGVLVGVIPGLGGSVASFLSYGIEKRLSSEPQNFGHGAMEGVAAAETADNAVIPAGFVPLFALGIPGSNVAALLIGAFLIHGITPGPSMFQQHGATIGGIYVSMLIASAMMLILGFGLMGAFARLALVPDRIIVPVVLCLCLIGAYLEGSGMSTVVLMLVFGVLGYFMRKFDYSIVCFLVGFILARPLEKALRQSMAITDGNPAALMEHPIALALLALACASAWWLSRGAALRADHA
jgi:putative tricarboxylic transport membrane protein